tara:strand:+ start:8438 stop:10051 length:1614 start_codon:yes stop_codon:yes gene_type:complete
MLQETTLNILKTGRNVYLTGAAGTGKTHVLNQYIAYLQKHNVGVGITASTGIAATHLGGMTIHAWSGIGIKEHLSEWDIDALIQRQPLFKRYQRTDVLIIDEISMLRPELLDMVDQVAKVMKQNEKPFGGMQVILSGDFFQLPPVVRNGSTDLFADAAHSWRDGDFRTCYLTEQYRQRDDDLLTILNDIRSGEISYMTQESLENRMNEQQEEESVSAVVLHTHNERVDERNNTELQKLNTNVHQFEMTSTGRAHLVTALKRSVLAPEVLELKVGAHVMFVKNHPEQEYVNGTLGEVVDLAGAYPVVQTHDGRKVVASTVSWETTDDNKVLASVSQIPLRLAWAITVHKSQGMSLDAVEVDLSRAFTPGQGYVALSRARTLRGLVLRGINATALQIHPYVKRLDERLQVESEHWDHIFAKLSDTKIQEMQNTFIKKIARNLVDSKKLSTYEKTKLLLEEKKSLKEIAHARNMTVGTIIGHLERLDPMVFRHLSPEEEVMREIQMAFEESGKVALTPIHKALGGRYSYDELRLARLFLT